MWREWLILIAVITGILAGLSLMTSAVSTAQPTQSTNSYVLPPGPLQNQEINCYGPIQLGTPYFSSASVICSPGSQSFTDTMNCSGASDVVVGFESSAGWTSSQVNCNVSCATATEPQTNCIWQVPAQGP